MKNIFQNIAVQELSNSVAVAVIFFYNNVLDKKLECVCTKEEQTRYCVSYMILPFFILFVFNIWMSNTFWKICCRKKCICCCDGYCCWYFVHDIVKAVFVGSLWVVSLLVDGDWFVCCKNSHIMTHPRLACKDPKNVTDEEQKLIADLKNESLVSFSCFITCCYYLYINT